MLYWILLSTIKSLKHTALNIVNQLMQWIK